MGRIVGFGLGGLVFCGIGFEHFVPAAMSLFFVLGGACLGTAGGYCAAASNGAARRCKNYLAGTIAGVHLSVAEAEGMVGELLAEKSK